MASKLSMLLDQTLVSVLERRRALDMGLEVQAADEAEMVKSIRTLREGITKLDEEQRAAEQDGSVSYERLCKNQDILVRLQTGFDKLVEMVKEGPSELETADPPLLLPLERRKARTAGKFDEEDAEDRAALFRSKGGKSVRFKDDPDVERTAGLDNSQHMQLQQEIMTDQDASLDRLSRSIGRQHELSIQIGDELDDHVELLDDVDGMVDRSQTRIDKARRNLRSFSKKAREHKSLGVIILLIFVLVLLIIILK